MTFLNMWGDCLEELQQQFDDLTEQKKDLWEQIKDKAENYVFEQTSEWKQIQEFDVKLLELDSQIKAAKQAEGGQN